MVPICLYCLNCTKFGQLILRKIVKIVATRWEILRLQWGAYSAFLDPLARFKGAYF